MAKFCKYCGTPLEEGQVCGCPAAQAAAQPAASAAPVATAAPAAPGKAGALFNDLKEVLLANLKSPAKANEKLLASPFKLGLAGILAGVNAIVIFFLMWSFLGALVGDYIKAINTVGSLMGQKIGYPIFPMLVTGIVIAALCVGLRGIALFVHGKIAKVEIPVVDALVIAAGNTVLPSALMLVAILMSLISLTIAAIVAIIAVWVWLACMNDAAREKTNLVASHNVKHLALVMLLRVVVTFVICWVSFKLIGWCLSDLIAPLGSMLGSVLGGILGGGSSSGGLGGLGGLGDLGDLLG